MFLPLDTKIFTSAGFCNIIDINEVYTIDLQKEQLLYKIEEKSIYTSDSNLTNILIHKDFSSNLPYMSISEIYQTYHSNLPGINISDNVLRLLLNICMDATFAFENGRVKRIQWKLSKKRKIEHLQELLNELQIPYTIRTCKKGPYNKLQPYVIRIYSRIAKILAIHVENKRLPNYLLYCNKHQVNIILDELVLTDGTAKRNNVIWQATNKHNFLLLQLIFILNDYFCTARLAKVKKNFKEQKSFQQQFRLSIREKRQEQFLIMKEIYKTKCFKIISKEKHIYLQGIQIYIF